MAYSTAYTIRFAVLVCAVCSVFVSGSAVLLKDRQEENRILERQTKVLEVAGLIEPGGEHSREEIGAIFERSVRIRLLDLATGRYDDSIDPTTYDQRSAAKDPNRSRPVPDNPAKVLRVPNLVTVFEVRGDDGRVEQYILPIEGKGLWSTLYGYLALDSDGNTIRGITFYEHGETPGLGGEVENPRWQAKWRGRKVAAGDGRPRIHVIKGTAGPPEEAPFEVDGLSGATLTSRGVTNMLSFWLGPDGFGPFLARVRGGEVS